MNWFGRDTSLMHLNESILCAITIKTTGPYAGQDQMIELCILALDAQLKPSKLALPFICQLKPKRPEDINILDKPEKGYAKRQEITKAALDGIDTDVAADRLDLWINKFQLRHEKKIFPLALDWPYIRSFFVDWLGPLNFDRLFDQRYRDLIPACCYVMDRADFLIEEKKFWKYTLTYLCKVLCVSREPPYDVPTDALAVAQCYKAMMKSLI